MTSVQVRFLGNVMLVFQRGVTLGNQDIKKTNGELDYGIAEYPQEEVERACVDYGRRKSAKG